MNNFLKKLYAKLNTRFGFFTLVLFVFWIKTYLVYITKFNLGIASTYQMVLAFINPLPFALLILGIALYFKGKKSYWLLLVLDFICSLWMFANILYYREFSDFLSLGIIKTSGTVSNNLGLSISEILHGTDFLVFVDVIVFALLLIFKLIKVDYSPVKNHGVISCIVWIELNGCRKRPVTVINADFRQ